MKKKFIKQISPILLLLSISSMSFHSMARPNFLGFSALTPETPTRTISAPVDSINISEQIQPVLETGPRIQEKKGLLVILTNSNDTAAFENQLYSSTPSYTSIDKAQIGDTVSSYIFLSGCTKGANGACHIEVDYFLQAPGSFTQWFAHQKITNIINSEYLHPIPVVANHLKPSDSAGMWRMSAQITDRNSGTIIRPFDTYLVSP